MRASIHELVLARLLQRHAKGGATQRELIEGEGFRRLVELARPGQSAAEAVRWAAEQLVSEGLAELDGSRFVLTERGAKQALGFLAVPALPSGLSWPQFAGRYLVPKALEVERSISEQDRRYLAGVEGLRCELVRQGLGLDLLPAPRKGALEEELGWTLLRAGASEALIARARKKKKFHRGVLLDVLCLTRAGVSSYKETAGVPALAAHFVGAAGTGANELLHAVLGRYFSARGSEVPASARRDANAAQKPTEGSDRDSLDAFVLRVLSAAGATEQGRFSDHLVFISHVWRQLRRAGDDCELEAFKSKLQRAYRERRIRLSKADMPQTLDGQDLSESRIEDGGVDLVFVEL